MPRKTPKKRQELWDVRVPGYMFFSAPGRWFNSIDDTSGDNVASWYGAWFASWVDVRTKRAALRMAARSPSGYAVIGKRGKRYVEYYYTAPGVDETQHPERLWAVELKKTRAQNRKPLTPRERMKRRK